MCCFFCRSWRACQKEIIALSQRIAKRNECNRYTDNVVVVRGPSPCEPGMDDSDPVAVVPDEFDMDLQLPSETDEEEYLVATPLSSDDEYDSVELEDDDEENDNVGGFLIDNSFSHSGIHDDSEESLKISLSDWIVRNGITDRGANELLRILIKAGLFFLPKDKRTLVGTRRSVPTISKSNGDYFYIGIKVGIEEIFSRGHFQCEVELDINVDGIPIFKSKKSQLWPILAKFGTNDPFLVSLFYGKHKPDPIDDYLDDILNELGSIVSTTQAYMEKTYSVNVRSFICDAPARELLKGIVHHGGYHSCERCTIVGEYKGRVVFSRRERTLPRTDDEFRSFSYHSAGKCHQHYVTALLRLTGFDLIKGFVLDSMHLVFLGVMRRLLFVIRGSDKMKTLRKGRLAKRLLTKVNEQLSDMNGKLPSEFARQPRSLEDLEYWKATEFRSFLMYTGMIVLKGIVTDDQYKHFLTLCLGIRLLSSPDTEYRTEHLEYSRNLLTYFVEKSSLIYGAEFVVYNVHGLIHIADDVEFFGLPLQSISAFPFENHLQMIKHSIRGRHNPVSEVVKRHEEFSAVRKEKHVREILVSTFPKDSCFKTSTRILVLKKKIDKQSFLCHSYKISQLDNLFSSPIESQQVGIHYVRAGTRHSECVMNKSQLVDKCAHLPYKRGFVVIPLVHLQV